MASKNERKTTAEAREVLAAAKCLKLAKSIRVIEWVGKTSKLQFVHLSQMGIGVGDGVPLRDKGMSASERASVLYGYVGAMMAADGKLLELGESDQADVKQNEAAAKVSRLLLGLLAMLDAREAPTPVEATKSTDKLPNIIALKSEDDLGFTKTTFTDEEKKRATVEVERLYGLRLRPHDMPDLRLLKKIAYWCDVEGAWPCPTRVPLSAMKRDPSDSTATCIRRLLHGVLCVSAGMEVPAGVRDDGAGKIRKGPPQWCSGIVVRDFLGEMEEVRDKMKDRQLERIANVICTSMHKASTDGKMSPSLALRQQIPKMAEYACEAAAALADGEVAGSRGPRSPAQAAKSPKAATPKTPKTPPTAKQPKAGKGTKRKFEDKDGEIGPNGLIRAPGGNPNGAKCKYIAEGKPCPFTTCSYSH